MEKIKNKIVESVKRGYRNFADYKITLGLLVLWTISLLADEVVPDGYRLEVEFLCRFLMLLFLSSFFVETCFRGKKKGMIIFYLLAGLLSVVLSYLVTYDNAVSEQAGGIMAGYAIILISLTIYFSFKKSGLAFGEYMGRVLSAMLPVLLIYIALSFWTVFSWATAEALFLIDGGETVIVLPFTLFLIPGCIYALNHVEKEIASTLSFIIKYIFNIFSVFVILIGYGYILRIVIMNEVPSNEIFGILTALFCMSAPVWIMNEVYEDGTFRSKMVSVLPYIFAPLIIMQIYSVAVRIMEYGFTCDRYLGIMVIIFEVITILFFIFKRNRCERLLLILAILTGISVAVPYINMYSISDINQAYFLNKYMQKAENGEELSELEYKRLEGAYNYQKKHLDQAKFEEQYGKAADFIENEKEVYQKQWHYLHGCQLVGEIETNEFTKMNMLNQSDTYVGTDSDEIIVDFSEFKFYKRETGEDIEIDLSDFYEKCMEYKAENPNSGKEEDSAYMKQFNIIPIDENSTFFVNHFEIDYYTVRENGEEVSKIRSMNISGMLLER